MSLETVEYGGPAVLTCDTCGKFREFGGFNSARRFLEVQKEKDPGWRTYNDGERFKHSCPKCFANWKMAGV